ncbi:MAG: gamma-glutamyltranspeptidase/glutathione hydrolase [Flavobacterium sp.]|jgi:gamma-glutamyltranspeptidase/glutathione hydrolase
MKLGILFAVLSLIACSEVAEEPTKISVDATEVWTKGAMATAANPHAVKAAIKMLEKGGHAVDAVIAAHAVLGLVEPQSSGIGGGAFMLVFNREGRKLSFHDGREMSPAGAKVDMFMSDGKVMGFVEAWQSGKAIGVPGAIALYKHAHELHGKLPWASLFQPAIELARNGFVVSPRLAGMLPRIQKVSDLSKNPGASEYFFPNGVALQAGVLLKNPEYADTLEQVSLVGIEAFYSGDIAKAIAAAAQAAPRPGSLTVEDLAAYKVIDREVICGDFRDVDICTTSPPSSGGAQIMIAGLYDHLSANAQSQSDKIAAFVDAQRLAYADRDHYFGDPDEIAIPIDDLLNPVYLKHRATEKIAPGAKPTPGDPNSVLHNKSAFNMWSADTTQEISGTTHLSIVDSEGNAVAMTATVEAPFGSSRWVGGFLLNNEMTDFARAVPDDGTKVANAIAPHRRPRSSMSPTMVFDAKGDLLMVTGSPGGNSIPAYVAKSILAVVDWGMDAQASVDFTNIIARGEKVRVDVSSEEGKLIAQDLKSRGYQVLERDGENSGLHVIVVKDEGLDGAADKRREGIVMSVPST